MGRFLPSFSAFGVAVLCTVVLFAIAAWIPNDAIDLVAWLVAIFVGVPASILTRVHAVRKALAPGRLVPALLTFLPRVLGALSFLLGVGILGWQAYILFIRRSPELSGPAAVGQVLLPVALVGLGYRLLLPSYAEQTSHDAA